MKVEWVSLILLLTLITDSASQDCSAASTSWLDWSNWSDCTDSCGSCGIHMRTRICLTNTSGCSCDGSGTELDYCNLNVCKYPRTTCCFNRTPASYQGIFACLNASNTSISIGK